VIETVRGYGTTDMLLERTPVMQVYSVSFRGETITDFVIDDPLAGSLYRSRGWEWTAGLVGWITDRGMAGTENPEFTVEYAGGFLLPGDDLQGTTFSVQQATKKFLDSANGFPVLAQGERIRVSGFATAGNNGFFTVASATEGEVVVSENLGGDESAGPQVLFQVRTLPREIERATLDAMGAHVIQRGVGGGNISSQSIGDLSVSFADTLSTQSSGLPLKSERMLIPWVRTAQA
jgi:hypothetical protein